MHAVRASALRFLAGLASCLDDRGVTSSEYALMATLIAVVISGAVGLFGQAVSNMFVQIAGVV